MSGGSFNYLYSKIEDDPIGWSTLESLENMADWLREQNHPASAELVRIHSALSEISDRLFRLVQNNCEFRELLKAAEWWCSNDIGQDDFERAWHKYQSAAPKTR